jgi:transposase
VKTTVEYGLKHRCLNGVTAIGVNEIQHGKGHQYLTLVYQIDAIMRRLLFVGQDRKAKTLLRFFRNFGRERCAKLMFVCSDIWKPSIKVIARKASNAVHILDRFHIGPKVSSTMVQSCHAIPDRANQRFCGHIAPISTADNELVQS